MENFKILEEKENPLFNRKEIKVSIEAEITPSHENAKKLISEKFSTQSEKIKIKKISGKFGSRTSIITANIYDSKESKDQTEPKSKKEIEEAKKEKPAEESKPEEKKVKEEIIKKESEVKEDIKEKEGSSKELSKKNKTESEKKTE